MLNRMLSPVAILLTLAGYVVLLFLVARLSVRRTSNSGFFTADRCLAWYQLWPAMISAAMSGVTFVSVPGSVAADGFSYLQMVAGFTVGQVVVAYWLVPLFYRWGYRSIYEYFGDRYGVVAHRSGGWFFFLSKLLSSALRLFVVVTVLQSLLFGVLGVSFGWSALLVVLVVWGYTYRGGVQAVIAADWVKTLLMLAALVGTIYVLITALDGSVGELWQSMWVDERSRVLFFDDPSSERYFWKMFVAGVVLLVAMTGLDQDMMQRNLACRSVRDAQRNILLTALCQAVVIALFLVLGWLLWRYAAVREMVVEGGGDSLFSEVAVSGGLPRWVGVLFVLGFAAASFSSVGASLTALTTSFSVDVMGGKRLDEKQLERIRKVAHSAIALLLFGLVLCFGQWADESAINLVYKVASYTYGPILGLFLFGLWSRLCVRDGWVWLIVVVAPLLTALLQWSAERWWGYEIGFELLLYNAALVMVGLWLIRRPEATS